MDCCQNQLLVLDAKYKFLGLKILKLVLFLAKNSTSKVLILTVLFDLLQIWMISLELGLVIEIAHGTPV